MNAAPGTDQRPHKYPPETVFHDEHGTPLVIWRHGGWTEDGNPFYWVSNMDHDFDFFYTEADMRPPFKFPVW